MCVCVCATDSLLLLPRCMECRCGLAMRILSVCLSIRPSVWQTHALWQNGRKICPDFYTIQNSVIALIVRFLHWIALQADYVTVVEDRPIISIKYCLPVPVFHFWPILTHPAAQSLCDSWASYVTSIRVEHAVSLAVFSLSRLTLLANCCGLETIAASFSHSCLMLLVASSPRRNGRLSCCNTTVRAADIHGDSYLNTPPSFQWHSLVNILFI